MVQYNHRTQCSSSEGMCRWNMREYSFTHRTINDWNKSIDHCINVSHVNRSKNKIDSYLSSEGR